MKIKYLLLLLTLTVLGTSNVKSQNKTIALKSFEKVVISPHIQIKFVQGDTESIKIDDIEVSMDKLNIDVSGKTLQVYLDDAKMLTKNEKATYNNYKIKHPIYDGTIVRATITYVHLNDVSLRGEETFDFVSDLKSDYFHIKIYGESKIFMNSVNFNSMKTVIYGESYLEIRNGKIVKQKITSYGESEINTMDVNSESIRITSYGESDLRVYASKNIKITSYGEARIKYKGNAEINKGIVFGETSIRDIN